MTRMVAVFVVLGLTTGAFGSVTSEFPVSTSTAAEAAFAQINPSVASSGSESFAVWFDTRSSTYDTMAPRSSLYGSRIDPSGHFVDPFGRRIADEVVIAHVASDGDGYLLLYSTYASATFAAPIESDGTFAQPAKSVSAGLVTAVASNGKDFLALMSGSAGEKFSAVFLDGAGGSHGRIDVGALRQPVLFTAGSDYRIVDQLWTCGGFHPCFVSIRLTSISSDTHQVTSRVVGPQYVPQSTGLSAVATNDRIVISLTSEVSVTQTQAERVATIFSTDLDGNILSLPRQIASGPTQCYCSSWQTLLAWDGTNVLVAWPDPIGELPPYTTRRNFVGVRVTPDGTPVDASPFLITSAFGARFAWTRNANGVLLLSSEQRRFVTGVYYSSSDLFVRQIQTFADLVSGGTAESFLETAPAQFDPAVASSAWRAIVAWRDFEQPSAIATAVIDVAHPSAGQAVRLSPRDDVAKLGVSVAILRDAGLVAWREETDRNVRVVVQRIGLQGTPLDAQPIEVANSARITPWPGTTSIATDGSQFFLVWSVENQVLGVRILPDGTVVDKDPILISRDEPYQFRHVDPRVIWTGTLFLAIWADDTDCHCLLVSPPPPPNTIVRTARLTSSGLLLDTTRSPMLVNEPGPVAEVAIARNGDRLMAVWSAGNDSDSIGYGSDECKHALPLDSNGNPLASTAVQFGCESLQGVATWPFLDDVKIVARDNGFVVMWSSNTTHDIAGVVVAADGTPSGPFVITGPSRPLWGADATATPIGTLVVYSHIASEPQYGGVARVFGRLLDNESGKRRSARH